MTNATPVLVVNGGGGGGGDPITVSVIGTSATDRSGTITTGGVAQNAMAANPARHQWNVYNNSDTAMTVSVIGTASATSVSLVPGGLANGKETNAVSVFGPTTGKAFLAWER